MPKLTAAAVQADGLGEEVVGRSRPQQKVEVVDKNRAEVVEGTCPVAFEGPVRRTG